MLAKTYLQMNNILHRQFRYLGILSVQRCQQECQCSHCNELVSRLNQILSFSCLCFQNHTKNIVKY